MLNPFAVFQFPFVTVLQHLLAGVTRPEESSSAFRTYGAGIMSKPIVAYYRVSTDRQGIRGLGIEAQQAAVEQYTRHTEGNLLAEYREAESGRKSDRPQLREALKHARRVGAVLVVAKLDRLSRNLAFLSALMEARIDFVCCDNPHANRLTLHILAAVAEDEAVRISERTKAALAAYKRRGGLLGTRDPRCALNRTPKGKEGQRKAADLSRQGAGADTVRLLVELGVDVNGQAGRESPLHCAARGGQLESVKLLVELGADVHVRDKCWNSPPLGFANYKGQRAVVEYLLQFARIWEAVEYGGLDRVRTLLRENPECVNARDDEGCTPLHYPFQDTQHGAEIVELLIEHGADVNARDNEDRTPVNQWCKTAAGIWRRFCVGTAATRHERHSSIDRMPRTSVVGYAVHKTSVSKISQPYSSGTASQEICRVMLEFRIHRQVRYAQHNLTDCVSRIR